MIRNIIVIFYLFTLASCFNRHYKVDNFSENELVWFIPFDKTDTIVYISQNREFDTIVFNKKASSSNTTRNFEQGFETTNFLTVTYEFTNGSYHQFAIMSEDGERYNQDFLNVSKSSGGYGFFELIFIGTIFSDDNMKNVQKLNDTTFYFESAKATYSGVNVEKKIKDFTFDTMRGIISYTDARGIIWRRN